MKNPEKAEWLNLNEGEEVRYWEHPSIITILPVLIMGLSVSLVGIALTIMYPMFSLWPLLLVPFGVFISLFEYIRWSRTHYVLTTVRIVTKKGILSRDYDEIPNKNITNTDSFQTFFQRVLDIGDIEIYTAGTGSLEMKLTNLSGFDRASNVISEEKTDGHE